MHEMLMALAGFPGDVFVYRRPIPPEDEFISSLQTPGLSFPFSSPPEHSRVFSPSRAQRGQSKGVPIDKDVHSVSFSQGENVGNRTEGGLFLNPELEPFLTSSERDLLSKIVVSGYHYLEIQEFISSVDFTTCRPRSPTTHADSTTLFSRHTSNNMDETQTSTADGSERIPAYHSTRFVGLYVSSLARAMDEMLQKYLRAVVEIEGQVLQQPLLPLTAVYVLLATEQQKLRTLHEVVTKVMIAPFGFRFVLASC